MEVRCCCKGSLQGFLNHPNLVKKGDRIRVAFMDHGAGVRANIQPPTGKAILDVELSVEEYGTLNDRTLAIKAEEIPIDLLRRVRGFIEATEEQKRDDARFRQSIPTLGMAEGARFERARHC